MARRRGNYRGGNYQFTARRRYALKRAQEISARKRKRARNKKIGVAAGAIAGIAVAGYLGVRASGGIRATNAGKIRAAFQPGNKEKTRINNAVSVGAPSRTTVIGPVARARADNARAALAKPRPDRKIYNHDDSVNSEAMTNRGVRATLRNARKTATGQKTEPLKGTPGGKSKVYPPGNPRTSRANARAWSDQQWSDALAFDAPVREPISGPAPRRIKRQ